MPENILASVVVPTRNGATYIAEVLDAVSKQKTCFAFETIVIDSGSTDGTPGLAGGFPVKLIRIDAQEFDHGATRDLGVRAAAGEFVAFLSQDSTPASDDWLARLIACLSRDPSVAGAYGRHIPRPDADPLEVIEINRYSHVGGVERKVFHRESAVEGEGLKCRSEQYFFSNSNSAIRRSIWDKIPFGKCAFGEDRSWASRVIDGGYSKVYEPAAATFHSHDLGLRETFERCRTHAMAMRAIFGERAGVHPVLALPAALKRALRDSSLVLSNSDFGTTAKVRAVMRSVPVALAKTFGTALGGRRATPTWGGSEAKE